MKNFWPLYTKEMKSLKSSLIVISVTYMVIVLFSHLYRGMRFSVTYGILQDFRSVLGNYFLVNMIIFPGLLLYSFHRDESHDTFYQMYSMPVPRYAVMLIKFIAVLSVSCAVTLLLALNFYIFEPETSFQPKILIQYPEFKTYPYTHPLIYALQLFSVGYLILCFAGVVSGILNIIKRYRVISGIVLFFALFKIHKFVYHILFSCFVWVQNSVNVQVDSVSIVSITFLMPYLLGSVYLLFGLYVFHKFSDI